MDRYSQVFEDGVDDEQSLILGVIDMRVSPETHGKVMSLEPECFMGRTHQLIWAGFQSVSKAGGFIDSFSTASAMTSLGANGSEISAMKELFSVGKDHFGPIDLTHRVDRVANLFKRRTIAQAMESLARQAMVEDLSEVESRLSVVVGKVAGAGVSKLSPPTDYGSQFESYLNGQPILPPESRENFIITGVLGLDKSIVANPGRLIVVGGLPSAGKTAFAVQTMVETAKNGRRVAMTSLEMDEDEIAARIVACACGVNSLIALRTGSSLVERESRYRLAQIQKNLVGIHGCAGDTWTTIEAAIAQEHHRSPLSVAIIDYLQLIGAPDTKKKSFDNEAQMIGEITKAAKRLAQKLKINVLLLSQFNRKIEEGEEPTLQHFLGSGQIERDADIALLLWNTDMNPEPGAVRPVACRIAKNRGGERFGKVLLDFDPATNRFVQNNKVRETTSSTGSSPY